MKSIHVELGKRAYDIHIGWDLVIGSLWQDRKLNSLLVSDSNVDPLYGEKCEAALRERGILCHRMVIPAGETSKNLKNVEQIYQAALQAGLDRSSALIALGGGMIGDLTGFAAATYLRGIPFVQVPTTLLAMVDSSVGGKTGVNLPQGKNLVGAFHQPVEVDADLSTLVTLPDREYRSGLAEVIKYGVIWDANFFTMLEKNLEAIRARDLTVLAEVVARCCEIKAEVVAMDERESGVRAILNFGHTLGHAVETVAGYGTLLHGEAVALGMSFAAEVSVRTRGWKRAEADRLISWLTAVGLPVAGKAGSKPVPWAELRRAMETDKKTRDGKPQWVLVERMGAVVFGCELEESMLEEAYASSVNTK